MKLQGSHLIQAHPEQVWAALNNPEILAACIPGSKEFVLESEDCYRTALEVALGPVKGVFKGRIRLSEKKPPEAMTLSVEAKAPVGTVRASGNITLSPVQDGQMTQIDWEGSPQLGGMIVSVGMRLISGVAKSKAESFFNSLSQKIA
ncbi:MAG: carbon monoxide dehydrogenase subunit G [Deinococcales bacterium]